MIKAVIFDINGVVISPKYDKIYRMLKSSAKKVGIEPIEDALMKKIIKLYRDERNVNLGILELAAKLNSMGIVTPALTNSPSERRNVYEKLGIFDKFDPFLTSEDIGAMKPERKAYEMVLNIIKLKPEECVFVDDNRSNLEGARALGMETILYKNVRHVKSRLKEMGVDIE